jgi:hypothetical protein
VHKGNAARALLYMSLRYDGLDSFNWTFDALNNVVLPGLSEAPQSVETLLDWHFSDLPDGYERARNDYIQSIQLNRNPFIDHPYWAEMINFHDLTYIPIDTTVIIDTTDTSDTSTVFVREIPKFPFDLYNNGIEPVVVLNNNQTAAQIFVWNAMGQVVLTKQNNSGIITFKELPNGLYSVRIQQEGREYFVKVLINH